MLEKHQIKAITDSYIKDMNYRLMRPLTSRFKTDTVYNFPAPNGYVELKAENPLNTPLLSFSEIAIQFEYAAVMPAVKFLAENKNAYSVSLPVQMRYELDGESISNNEINIVNGTLDIFIIETIHNDIEMNFTFTTTHDNITYVANIEPKDLIAQVMAAKSSKEFQG